MDDELEVRLQDLELDEIRELLAEAGAEVAEEQIAQLVSLVQAAGGIHEALEWLAQLPADRRAA